VIDQILERSKEPTAMLTWEDDVVDRQSKDDLGPAPGGDCHLLGVCGVRNRDGSGRGGPHGGGAVEHRVGTAGATIWLNGWLNSG